MGVDLLNIEGLKELEQQGPVVMVNLMRFHERALDGDGSGWDAYLRYSALTVPIDQGARRYAAVDRRGQDGRARPARRRSMGLSGAGALSRRRRLHRHEDVGGLRESVRSASPQRLCGACDYCDRRGLQQIQDRLDAVRRSASALFLTAAVEGIHEIIRHQIFERFA